MTAAALVKQPLITLAELRQMQAQVNSGQISWVYFIFDEETDRIKIGRSSSPARRCAALSSSMGKKLDLTFAFRAPDLAERILHRILYSHQSSHEWFSAAPEVDQMIECFEDECVGLGNDTYLSAERVEQVLICWATSYGRGQTPVENKESGDR